MLYETLKWPQITPFCISSKKTNQGWGGADPDPLPFKNYGLHTIKSQLHPCSVQCFGQIISKFLSD
jgi:hypothetical protein